MGNKHQCLAGSEFCFGSVSEVKVLSSVCRDLTCVNTGFIYKGFSWRDFSVAFILPAGTYKFWFLVCSCLMAQEQEFTGLNVTVCLKTDKNVYSICLELKQTLVLANISTSSRDGNLFCY